MAGLTAVVWWCSRSPGAGVAVPAPLATSPSRPPVERPFAPIDVARPGPAAARPARRDPVLEGIPGDSRHAVVVDVNALAHAPLGKLWLECLDRHDREDLAALREAGIDPAVDVSRVALAWGDRDETAVGLASGFFGRARPGGLGRFIPFGAGPTQVEPEGDGATVIRAGDTGIEMILWGDQVAVMGLPDRARASLDLLRGRTAGGPFVLPASLEAAEVQAVVSAQDLAKWLEVNDPALRRWLSALETRAEVRVDAMGDIRAEARVTVEDPAAAGDLAAMFAAAVAAERAAARAKGDWQRAELLEHVSVAHGAGEFRVRLDLPLEALERQFSRCRDGR